MTCPECGRQVAELLPVQCVRCDLDRAEAVVRQVFGPITVEETE